MRETRLALKSLALYVARRLQVADNNQVGSVLTVSVLSLFLESLGPVGHQPVKGFFCGAIAGDHIIVEPFLRCLQKGRICRLGPEILHDRHAVEEGLRIGRTGDKARILDHGAQGREAAEFPPLGLHFGLCEPFDVGQRRFLLFRGRDDRNALPAQLCELVAVGAGGVGKVA